MATREHGSHRKNNDIDTEPLIEVVETSQSTNPAFKVPEIPYNKDFHLFVCYVDENVEDVRTIVENLEREGLKCCYHERDFTAGQNVFQNIHNGIEKSIGILIVLSEEFVNGLHQFCDHEIQQALLARTTQGYIVIPIKTEPCSVPPILKQLSYIDAQRTEVDEMHVLVLNAFVQNVWQSEHNETNGQTVSVPLTKFYNGWKWLSLSRYKLDIDFETRSSIWEKGFQLSPERIDTIEKLVSDSVHVKYKHVLWMQNCLLTLVFFMVSLLNVAVNYTVVALTTGRKKDVEHHDAAAQRFLISILVIIFVWLIFLAMEVVGHCFKLKYWKGLTYKLKKSSKERLKRELWSQINSKLTRKDKLILIFMNDTLSIVRFNVKPCQDMFVRRCGRREALTCHIRPGETHTEYAERIFDWYIKENSHMLMVPDNKYSRHEMVNGASCLCLLVERLYFGE